MHTLRSRKLSFEGSSANIECFDLPLPFYKVPSTACATRPGLPASMYFCLWFPYHLYHLSRSSLAISYSESSPKPGKHLLGQDVTNLAVLPPPTVFREPLINVPTQIPRTKKIKNKENREGKNNENKAREGEAS